MRGPPKLNTWAPNPLRRKHRPVCFACVGFASFFDPLLYAAPSLADYFLAGVSVVSLSAAFGIQFAGVPGLYHFDRHQHQHAEIKRRL